MSRRAYQTSRGNVFRDLRGPHAEEHLVKAQLVFKIDTIMKERRLKQVEAAARFGIRQPDVSKMLSGCCGSSLRSIRTSRSSSRRIAIATTRRHSMCPQELLR
jgi:predicted XRE-type DNA-binding protein